MMFGRVVRCTAWVFGALLAFAPAVRAADMSGSFSIIMRDPDTGELGVGVMSNAPACGMLVPWVEAGVGAIATQGETNGSWGPRGLKMLREGVPVQVMVESLMTSDELLQRRQIGALDATGWPAGYTGNDLINWTGGSLDSNLAVQGNNMPGHEVLDAVVDSVRPLRGRPLAEQLLATLARADRLRADWRGVRSAAILVGRANPDRPEDASRYVYLRVDDDPAPIAALDRLYRAWRAAHMVGAYLDYAAFYRKSGLRAQAEAEMKRARAAVSASIADTSLGAPTLNAMAWQLAQRGAMLDQAWVAIERARRVVPRSTELNDTAAEVRYRQGRLADALALATEASRRVPRDDYLRSRAKFFAAEVKKPPAGPAKPMPKK